MASFLLITACIAGAATAFTPTGFVPASTNNLTVAYGSVLAIDGTNIPKNGN
jgi:hypothetical protein